MKRRKNNEISVEPMTLPDGSELFALYFGNERAGNISVVPGGFQANRKKKPVATIRQAAEQIFSMRVSDAIKEQSFWQRAESELMRTDGRFPTHPTPSTAREGEVRE